MFPGCCIGDYICFQLMCWYSNLKAFGVFCMCARMSLVPFVVPITVIQFYSYGMVSSLFSDGCVIFFFSLV